MPYITGTALVAVTYRYLGKNDPQLEAVLVDLVEQAREILLNEIVADRVRSNKAIPWKTIRDVLNDESSAIDEIGQLLPGLLPPSEKTGTLRDVVVELPDIGDFKEVEIIEILVSPGDRIVADQSLITLESDKAIMEIPSPFPGIVRRMLVKIGDKVSAGDQILVLENIAHLG